jgi:hypothetical protein
VHVDGDSCRSTRHAQSEIGAFRTDTLERSQELKVAWKVASKLFDGTNRDVSYLACFGFVKCALVYQGIYLAN